jgi:site-specific DNA-methyltransferase (adenine-specific)
MTPYYQSGGVTLYHGDCRDVLARLPAGSVGHVVTDPPYGQSNEDYDGPATASLADGVWTLCRRACGESAALLSLSGNPTYHRLAAAIESAGWKIRQMWGWVYKDGLITSAYPKEGFDRVAPALTPIVFATAGKVLLPLKREGEAWVARQKPEGGGFSGRSDTRSPDIPLKAAGHWPKSVVSTDGVDGFQYFCLSNNAIRHGDGLKHPNRKPLCLMEWLVDKLPAGVILDPFAGSGTTLEAAARLGRQAVGVEFDERYCELAALSAPPAAA